MEGLSSILLTASVWVLPVLIAITLHEAAHGYVAWKLGDDTAYRLGRVTFNPFKHIDRFGTVILPGLLLVVGSPFLFGYAKPVPVNFLRLRNPKRDMVWVAAAGPGVNIGLAVAAALLVHLLPLVPEWAQVWGFANLRNAEPRFQRAVHVGWIFRRPGLFRGFGPGYPGTLFAAEHRLRKNCGRAAAGTAIKGQWYRPAGAGRGRPR